MIRKATFKRFESILRRFSSKRILVIGDLMIDQFVWGEVDRISPEAPVPVVRFQSETYRLGGAANVAANLNNLGAEVVLAGVVGEDAAGQRFSRLAAESGIDAAAVIADPSRSTILKQRIIAHGQQVVRLDREETAALSAPVRRSLLGRIGALAPVLDGVVISDYGKGVIGSRLMTALRKALADRDIPIAVDPQVNNTPLYRNTTVITPNHHEAGAALGRKLLTEDDVLWAGRTLQRRWKLKAALITRGEKGMSLFQEGDRVLHIPTVAREVFDVTGAGDTVIAALTLALAAGASMEDAAAIANFAAGIVVGEVGTASVPLDRLIATIRAARVDPPKHR